MFSFVSPDALELLINNYSPKPKGKVNIAVDETKWRLFEYNYTGDCLEKVLKITENSNNILTIL